MPPFLLLNKDTAIFHIFYYLCIMKNDKKSAEQAIKSLFNEY
jgi:hypothetical protein